MPTLVGRGQLLEIQTDSSSSEFPPLRVRSLESETLAVTEHDS